MTLYEYRRNAAGYSRYPETVGALERGGKIGAHLGHLARLIRCKGAHAAAVVVKIQKHYILTVVPVDIPDQKIGAVF